MVSIDEIYILMYVDHEKINENNGKQTENWKIQVFIKELFLIVFSILLNC